MAGRGNRVVIIGDVMLDEYLWGEVQRISPEAPVPIVEVHRRSHVPGGAANVAANVVSLGGQVVLGGVLGHDSQASLLRSALEERGVGVGGLITDDQRPTTVKTRIVASSQQVVRVDSERRDALQIELENRLLQWAEAQLDACAVCILSDYAKGVVSPRLAEHVISMARQANKPVIVDPKGTDYAKYRGATVLTPNIQEAERALHVKIDGNSDVLEAGRRLLQLLHGSALLITRGAQGMSLFLAPDQIVHIPAAARTVFDVTGAGDTVVSTLAIALAAELSLEDAAHLANKAGGIVVGKVGTTTVTLDELMASQYD